MRHPTANASSLAALMMSSLFSGTMFPDLLAALDTPLTAPGFAPFALDTTGLIADLAYDEYPTAIYAFDGDNLFLPEGATYYGMVTEGSPFLFKAPNFTPLSPGQYFVIEGPARIVAEGAKGLVIARLGYIGYPQIGGPIENTGRLKYIDGCSDTLLVCPPVIGEPCLNHLHIPANTNQTAHTHPSQRIGVIVRGSGYCLTRVPEGEHYPAKPFEPFDFEFRDDGTIWKRTTLSAGMGWWIPTGLEHSFHTGEGETLDVIAWHPDSDFGPEHDNHPMVNRTYVNDTSARDLPDIRTEKLGR